MMKAGFIAVGLSFLSAIACGGEDRGSAGTLRDSATSRVSQSATLSREQGIPPACGSSADVVCFRTTATGHNTKEEPGWIIDADWIVFAAAGDSLELFAVPDSANKVTAAMSTNYGQDRDEKGNTASSKRLRMTTDGLVSAWITLESIGIDTVGYTLIVRRVSGRETALRSSGALAMLTIESRNSTDRLTVVPFSARRPHADSSWAVLPRAYHVALTADSLYEICSFACLLPDSVVLKPGSRAIRRY